MGSSSIDKAKGRISGGGIAFGLVSGLFFFAWLSSLGSPSSPTGINEALLDSSMSLEAMQKATAVLDPELMLSAPSDKIFVDAYLNPCYKSSVDALRCLPYAYISGFQTGARALARSLAAHDNVVFDIGAAYGPWPTSQQQQGYSKGYWNEYRNQLQSYLGHIISARLRLDKSPKSAIVIDGSMSTLDLFWAGNTKAHRAFSTFAVDCWRTCNDKHKGSGVQYEECMDNKCLKGGREADAKAAKEAGVDLDDLQLPMLMRAVYGKRLPKFVFLLRDPVDRLFSSYFGSENLYPRTGKDIEGFRKYLKEQLEAFDLCKRNHTEEDCVLRFESLTMAQEKVFYHCDQIFRGFYAMQLKQWFKFFPRSSFLIIESQEYFSNPKEVTIKVLTFLGLKHPSDEEWLKMNKAGPSVSNVEGRVMPKEEREMLARLYQKPNIDLATLLNNKSWLKWNDKKLK